MRVNCGWSGCLKKKKKKQTLLGYRYISGIQHPILDQTSALIGSWLALQRSWQRSRSAWPPTVCMHAQHYTSLPLVPSTDEEIKTNGCSSGFWSVFWLPITLPGGIATLSVICLQCLLRVQLIFQKKVPNCYAKKQCCLTSERKVCRKILQFMAYETRVLQRGNQVKDFWAAPHSGWIIWRNCWMKIIWSFVL